MKIKRRLKKRAKQVRDLVPDNVVEGAAAKLNPLAENQPAPLSDEDVPRITNETITEHREAVLSGARKYIYPLRHSKRRIVVVTTSIITSVIIGLLVYCVLALYKYYQYNAFLYHVTQVVPFPVARVGNTFVDYENYLFEVRHYVHYYQTQYIDTFSSTSKPELLKQQFLQYRKQALNDVINNAYIKKLAAKNRINVSDKEISTRITDVRNQNRLGSNDKVFADVLRDYWGWSVADFKRALKSEILAEKVAAKLDTATQAKAQSVLAQAKGGADFASLGGADYGFGITKNNPNVPPQVVDALFQLKPGQISDIIVASPVQNGAPVTLEIVKVLTSDGATVTAQHISYPLKDVKTYVEELKKKQPPRTYVKF